jgi:hypothetical protein
MKVLLVNVPELIASALLSTIKNDAASLIELIPFAGDARDLELCKSQSQCDIILRGLEFANEIDALEAAGRVTWNLLTTTSAKRYILLSSMDIFGRSLILFDFMS